MPDLVLKVTDEQLAVMVEEASGNDVASWALEEILERTIERRVVAERARLEAASSTAAAEFAESKRAEADAAADAFETALRTKVSGGSSAVVADGVEGGQAK